MARIKYPIEIPSEIVEMNADDVGDDDDTKDCATGCIPSLLISKWL